MAKQVLRHLDTAALAVALDRAEDEGLISVVPSPEEQPDQCVYLKYVGEKQAELISSRLPHVIVQLRTPAGAGKNKKLLPVYHKSAIRHVLGFLLTEKEVAGCIRSLDTVDHKYWKVM